jgi:NAD(P)-dependent dehydrogenase (short-subunit alcohol dehydrogenase family)
MGDRLHGKVAIVFGAGTGGSGSADCVSNGHATAMAFAAQGARVLAVDRDAAAVGRTRDAINGAGGECTTVVADVTSGEQVADAVEVARRTYGRLDIVHNNVGVTRIGGPVELSEEDWNAAFDVNVTSVFRVCKYALPHMLDRGGAVINVSSLASIRWTGYPYPSYSAAKSAVNQLTQSLALHYAPHGIRVNAILPGLLHTPLIYQQLSAEHGGVEAMRAQRDAASPTGRMGTAWDVAGAAVFLASDEATYINGVLLPVDGGLHAKAG